MKGGLDTFLQIKKKCIVLVGNKGKQEYVN